MNATHSGNVGAIRLSTVCPDIQHEGVRMAVILSAFPRRALHLTSAAALLFCASSAVAQSSAYPNRPVRFVVANSPGGGLDITARTMSPKLLSALGQQWIIDNRAGAAGSLAAEITAKSPPDGYTVLMGSIGNMSVNAHLYKGLGYHPLKDLAPVTSAVSSSNVLVTNPSVPARNVQELIALARSQPGKLTYGSSGAGNAGHLAAELFKSMAKVDMVHVPYKGGAPAMVDLIAGQVQLVFSSAPTAIPQVKAGKIRALAVTTAKRSVLLPELPTISESGLPGFEADNWYGVAVAAKTPRAIIDRLNTEFVRILNSAEIKDALLKQGLEVSTSTPDAFGVYMKSEFDKWGKVIREAGIVAN
jgi:tripartite-type tricarboxylate transporter receptor subunit TctC